MAQVAAMLILNGFGMAQFFDEPDIASECVRRGDEENDWEPYRNLHVYVSRTVRSILTEYYFMKQYDRTNTMENPFVIKPIDAVLSRDTETILLDNINYSGFNPRELNFVFNLSHSKCASFNFFCIPNIPKCYLSRRFGDEDCIQVQIPPGTCLVYIGGLYHRNLDVIYNRKPNYILLVKGSILFE